jgi:hypothetical protein
VIWEANLAREAACLEAVRGEPADALDLFETAIDMLHRAGDVGNVAVAFTEFAVLLDRLDRPEIAATLYDAGNDIGCVFSLPGAVDHLRTVLGQTRFDKCVAAGAAMELNDAVQFARRQIELTRSSLSDPTISRIGRWPPGGRPP